MSAASFASCDISILISRNWLASMGSQCWGCDADDSRENSHDEQRKPHVRLLNLLFPENPIADNLFPAREDCGEHHQVAGVTQKTLNSFGGQDASPQKIGSKETPMPTMRFKRIALAQLFATGCAVAFGACVLIEHAQAQPGYVPPSPPPPPPVFNPSSPYTVPQPSYTPLAPSTPSTTPSIPSTIPEDEVTSPTIPRRKVTSPANEEPASTTPRSERTSVAKKRSVHHHRRGRSISVEPTLGSFYCPYGWCVRISPPAAYYQPYGWYR